MSTTVTRHFVTIDGRWGPRQVHYRRAGTGPAVLLLHQSPQSSREMVDLMARWALHFTVIAPDTPGYGQSDPLGPETLTIAGIAEAVGEFANAVGLHRFGVYGYHTGASIGLWLAAREPGRVTALAANGLARFTDAERAAILTHYLPPLEPRWDGGHLAWLWARVREQTVFFPWHERSAAARLDLDMPLPERLQASVLEFLRAGAHYATAYRAAFESHPEAVLPGLTVPLLITASPGDPLRRHFTRYPTLAPGTTLQTADSATAAVDAALAHLLAHRGDAAPAPVAARALPGRLSSRIVTTDATPVRVRCELSGSGEPLMLLHAAGESAATVERLALPLLGERPLVIVDLPGHGESDPPLRLPGPTVRDCASAAAIVLRALGLNEVVLAGIGAGACTALEMAREGVLRRPQLRLIDLPVLPAAARDAFIAQALPSLAPEWHGGHLLLAWHLVRDGRSFFPWFERTRRGARHVAPDLDDARLHIETVELLKASGCWQALSADALHYPAIDTLDAIDADVVLGAATDSPWREPTRHAASETQQRFVTLPAAPAGWLRALLDAH